MFLISLNIINNFLIDNQYLYVMRLIENDWGWSEDDLFNERVNDERFISMAKFLAREYDIDVDIRKFTEIGYYYEFDKFNYNNEYVIVIGDVYEMEQSVKSVAEDRIGYENLSSLNDNYGGIEDYLEYSWGNDYVVDSVSDDVDNELEDFEGACDALDEWESCDEFKERLEEGEDEEELFEEVKEKVKENRINDLEYILNSDIINEAYEHFGLDVSDLEDYGLVYVDWHGLEEMFYEDLLYNESLEYIFDFESWDEYSGHTIGTLDYQSYI
jgi:hypothetical protein